MKAATIYDVAKAAGVSHQTVTRYLHGYEGIRESTRMRVKNALSELDYRPNNAARQLRMQASNRVAVLADRIGETGPSRIVQAIADRLRDEGFVIDIIVVDGSDPTSVDAAIGAALDNQVAGILATAQTDLVLEQLQARPLAVPIIIDAHLAAAGSEELLNRMAGRLAAEHLLDTGHTSVGYVTGASSWFAAKERAEGFAATVRSRGAHLVWQREGDWTAASGYGIWQGLDDSARSVTAIAAGNDAMAIGLMAAIVDDGIQVPEELSIIGTDGTPEGQFVRPSLSTIEIDFESEGAALAAELIRRIRDDAPLPPAEEMRVAPLPPRIVARSSSSSVLR